MRDRFEHWESIAVRWGDQDALGHVNNANYFVYFESARLSFLDAVGVWPRGRTLQQGPILAYISCNFRSPLTYPATISVGTRFSKLGNKSFTVEQAIFKGDETKPVADGSSVIVWVDYETGQTIPIPEPLRKAASIQLERSLRHEPQTGGSRRS